MYLPYSLILPVREKSILYILKYAALFLDLFPQSICKCVSSARIFKSVTLKVRVSLFN
jgi:hypothetical protein